MVMSTLPRGWRVYKATNLLNGCIYIGVTGQLLSARRKAHKSKAKNNPDTCFARAIARHGFENFEFGEIALFDNKQDAWDLEQMLIAELEPAYNIDRGGPGSQANLGKVRPIEWCNKLSEAHLKKWKTNRNQNSLDALNKGRERYAKEIGSKKVRLVEDGRVFPSLKEAAKVLGVRASKISQVVNGQRKSTGGMRFEFVKVAHGI